MNIFLMLIKQLRQRALATWLTTLSVILGVALGVAVLVAWRESERLFAQSDFGIDLIVGPRSSATQLVLNSLYHMDESPGVIPYSFYERMQRGGDWRKFVQQSAPLVVGDSFEQYRLIGTLPSLFGFAEDGATALDAGAMEVRLGQPYRIATGKCFNARKFEAVIGSEVAQKSGLSIGSVFQATHGLPNASAVPDIHPEKWTVVGILAPTHTPNDRVIFLPIQSLFAIAEHEEGIEAIQDRREKEDAAHGNAVSKKPEAAEHDHHDEHDGHEHHHDGDEPKGYTLADDGIMTIKLPKDEWLLSAVLVKSRGPSAAIQLYNELRTNRDAMGAYPAQVMRQFFDLFIPAVLKTFLAVASMVIVVAGVSILVSIYNSISGRMQDIAIMRALGATQKRIVLLICLEAGGIGAAGAILGLLAGHLMVAAAAGYMQATAGVHVNWILVSPAELIYAGSVVILATIAGVVPALKAYRVPVADNL